MTRATLTAVALACLCTPPAFATAVAHTDSNGRIRGLDLPGDAVAVLTDLRIPLEGWKPLRNLDMAREPEAAAVEGGIASLRLAQQSLLTLTPLPAEAGTAGSR